MQAAIIFDSQTGHTATAATYIAEGVMDGTRIEARTFHIDQLDMDYTQSAELIIFGSPTYMASTTGKMKLWLEQNGNKLNLAGKLGGAFATEQYIHGGAETAVQILLTHELVLGMMTYSGGISFGKPVIHIARDDRRMAAMREALGFFAPQAVVLEFPAWDTTPYDRVSPAPAVMAARMAVDSSLPMPPQLYCTAPFSCMGGIWPCA